jgi:hypothetical protein
MVMTGFALRLGTCLVNTLDQQWPRAIDAHLPKEPREGPTDLPVFRMRLRAEHSVPKSHVLVRQAIAFPQDKEATIFLIMGSGGSR